MRILIILVSLAASGFVSGATATSNPALPRYAFAMGRRLIYRGTSTFTYDGGVMKDVRAIQLTVVGQNTDGSWRIIVRTARRSLKLDDDLAQAEAVGPETGVSYSEADMFANGRIASLSDGIMDDTPEVLPPLPANETELHGTWSFEPKLPGNSLVFNASGDAANGACSFHSSEQGIFKTIYGISHEKVYRFDMSKGVIESISCETRQDYGFKGTGSEAVKLRSDETLAADQVAALVKDCAALFAMRKETPRMWEDAAKSAEGGSAAEVKIRARIEATRAGTSSAEIREEFTGMLSGLNEDAKYYLGEAKRKAKILNHPAPDITAVDLDHKPHRLIDYRGKVVVLDFWYRGCGWCMRAMPQMKQVSQDFAGKPVVVLGMNTDSKEEDAAFVVQAMGLPYATWRIDFDVAKKFGVGMFPALVVIDKDGIVRYFDEGYSPTLRVDLEKEIRELLGEKEPATQTADTR